MANVKVFSNKQTNGHTKKCTNGRAKKLYAFTLLMQGAQKIKTRQSLSSFCLHVSILYIALQNVSTKSSKEEVFKNLFH